MSDLKGRLHYRVVYQWRAGQPGQWIGDPCTRGESEKYIAMARTKRFARPAYRLRIKPRAARSSSPDNTLQERAV